MHLTDKSVGFISSSAIVGNSIPIGVGLSLSQKLEKQKNLTLIFFGDGATEQGVFYESINFQLLKIYHRFLFVKIINIRFIHH